MWFTEDAWGPIIIFIMIGMGLAFVASSQQKPRLYVAAGFMLLLGGLTYVIEQSVVTDGEQIEAAIYDLAKDFQEKNSAGVLDYISPQQLDLQVAVTAALNLVTIEDDYRITDVDVSVDADGTLATSHFRANVTATVIGFASKARQPTRWNVKWRKEGEKWRIVEVHQLDPMKGTEITVWQQITQ